jgi:hypothetical protein
MKGAGAHARYAAKRQEAVTVLTLSAPPREPRRANALRLYTALALALSGCGLLGTSPGGGSERTSIDGEYDHAGTSPTGEFVELAFADESVSAQEVAAGYQIVDAGDPAGEQQFLAALGGQATDPLTGLAAAPSDDPAAVGTTVATGDDAPYAGYTGYTGDTGQSDDGIGVSGYALGPAAVALALPVAAGAMMLGSAAIVAMPKAARSGARGDSYQVIDGATVNGKQVAASSDTLTRLSTWLQAKFSSPEQAASTIADRVAATGPAGQMLAAAVRAVVARAWKRQSALEAGGADRAAGSRAFFGSMDLPMLVNAAKEDADASADAQPKRSGPCSHMKVKLAQICGHVMDDSMNPHPNTYWGDLRGCFTDVCVDGATTYLSPLVTLAVSKPKYFNDFEKPTGPGAFLYFWKPGTDHEPRFNPDLAGRKQAAANVRLLDEGNAEFPYQTFFVSGPRAFRHCYVWRVHFEPRSPGALKMTSGEPFPILVRVVIWSWWGVAYDPCTAVHRVSRNARNPRPLGCGTPVGPPWSPHPVRPGAGSPTVYKRRSQDRSHPIAEIEVSSSGVRPGQGRSALGCARATSAERDAARGGETCVTGSGTDAATVDDEACGI